MCTPGRGACAARLYAAGTEAWRGGVQGGAALMARRFYDAIQALGICPPPFGAQDR